MADNCGSYVNAEDLKAAKESINHIEHVATSKDADGNPALVVTDPIRGANYTNKTIEGFFARLGFQPVDGSFQDGGTLNNRWDVLLNTADNSYYQWMGSLPKVVSAGSTPATSGGVSASAWVNQTDLTLRSQLAAASGIDLIGGMSSEARPGYGLKFGDTSGAPSISVSSSNTSGIQINKILTEVNDFGVLCLNRTASNSGGTPGYVGSSLRATIDVTNATHSQFEWAIVGIVNNYANASENVGIYGQGNKHGKGGTWGGVWEVCDFNDRLSASGDGLTWGGEVDVWTDFDDPVGVRQGLTIVIGSKVNVREGNVPGQQAVGSVGLNVTSYGGNSDYAIWKTGIKIDKVSNVGISINGAVRGISLSTGSYAVGVDLSQANISAAAIRLKSNQRISLDENDTNLLYSSSSGIVTQGRLNMTNSFAIPSSGNTSANATAGGGASLPATVSGFVNFMIDGVVKKIPYYN